MDYFISLATTLVSLSLIAERIITWLKLYFGQLGKQLPFFSNLEEDLTQRSSDPVQEKIRERKILGLTIVVCILIALVINANLFEILSNRPPTATLGWTGVVWAHGAGALTLQILRTVLGCICCGFCISLGSKFWHDLLDMLLSVKTIKQNMANPNQISQMATQADPSTNMNTDPAPGTNA